jgi:hypothetical protein
MLLAGAGGIAFRSGQHAIWLATSARGPLHGYPNPVMRGRAFPPEADRQSNHHLLLKDEILISADRHQPILREQPSAIGRSETRQGVGFRGERRGCGQHNFQLYCPE